VEPLFVVWLSVCPVCVLFVFCLRVIYLYDSRYSHARSSCIYSTGLTRGTFTVLSPAHPCASSILLVHTPLRLKLTAVSVCNLRVSLRPSRRRKLCNKNLYFSSDYPIAIVHTKCRQEDEVVTASTSKLTRRDPPSGGAFTRLRRA
jgi:hypothetical protein